MMMMIDKLMDARKQKKTEQEVKWWTKLLLLPRVLFARVSKATTIANINKVFDDEWDFVIGDFPLRKAIYNRHVGPLPGAQLVPSVKNYLEDFTKTQRKI